MWCLPSLRWRFCTQTSCCVASAQLRALPSRRSELAFVANETSGPKFERRVAAMEAEMGRVLKRLASLSIAMMRADAAWEAYNRERTRVVQASPSEDELDASMRRQLRRVENNDFFRAAAYLSVWFALLYVVVEGWRKWKFFDAKVDPLLTANHIDELKAYRHAIFHAEEFDAPAVMLFEAKPDRSKWISELSNELRRALRDWNENLPKRLDEYLRRSPL